jgi:hypothetical protein
MRQKLTCFTNNAISINEPTPLRVIISALEVIQLGLVIIPISRLPFYKLIQAEKSLIFKGFHSGCFVSLYVGMNIEHANTKAFNTTT